MNFFSLEEWSIEDSILFDQICASNSLEGSESSVTLSKRRLSMQKYRNKRRTTQQDLTRLVGVLQEKLEQLQERRDLYHIVNPPSSRWYELALKEKILYKRAQEENEQLKEMVRQQETLTKSMTGLITKAMNLPSIIPNSAENQWQNRILVKDPKLRIVGMHQILDYEYSRLNSAFVEAGLHEASTIFHKLGTKFNPVTGFELQKIVCHPNDVSMNLAIESIWKMLHGMIKIDGFDNEVSYIRNIDADTSYITSVLDFPIGQVQRRLLCKRYYPNKDSKDKCVIIMRNIVQDEETPVDAELPLLNEVSWSVAEATSTGMTFHHFSKQSIQAQDPLSKEWSSALEEYFRCLQDASHAYMHSKCPESKSLAPEVTAVEPL